MFFFQALLYGSCVSQKDKITKHACDKEFQALKACIRQAVSFLVDWSGSLFFLCLISLDIMLVLKHKRNCHDKIVKWGHKSVLSESGVIKKKAFALSCNIFFGLVVQSLFQFKLC